MLGLPNIAAGIGNIGDYSFTYTTQNWLYTLTDTSKTNQTYGYVYSSSKELTQLNYPNTLQLHQTWSSKMLDLLTVTDTSQQTTYLSSDATFNGNEQMTDYDFSVNAGQSSFSESYDLTYDSLGRLSTMETDSTSRTVTHGYDAGNGQLSSLSFSDLGTYGIDYLTNGNIDSITYPNSQGEETYTYAGGKGRLSKIEYPNDDTLEFDWNDKDEVTRITYTEYATQEETRYTMTYTQSHEIATLAQSIDSIQQYVWALSWAPNGLEKAVKTVNGLTVLTQDFTTDPQGRILSMTYDTTGEGYDGELYFHYDHFGDTTLLTDTNGNPIFSAQYDPCRGTTLQSWNNNNLEIINQGRGRFGTVSMSLPGSFTALIASSGTITISEEVISAFIARYGTNLVCYVEDYGPQSSVNGNPDANPCEDCESWRKLIDEANKVIDYWNKQIENVDKYGCYYFPDENFNETKQKRTINDAIQKFSKEKRSSIYSKCPLILIGFLNNIQYWINCVNNELNKAAKSTLKNEIRGYMKGAETEKKGWCNDYCKNFCDMNDENPIRGKDYGDECGCLEIRDPKP